MVVFVIARFGVSIPYLSSSFIIPQIHQGSAFGGFFCIHEFSREFGPVFGVFGAASPLELALGVFPPDFGVTAAVVQLPFSTRPRDAVHDPSRRYSVDVSLFSNF
jgi:hypothetical protein